ncbi:MAG: flagellar basal-body MS-ring/collar protein FliF [Spirochaetia bacterium]
MKDFFEKAKVRVTESWKKWTGMQKVIFLGVLLAVFAGIGALVSFNATPVHIRVFGSKIADEELRNRVTTSLDSAGVPYTLSPDGQEFYVENEKIARKARAILVREGLTPGQVDPWNLFDVQRWTTTQLEQSVNLQRSLTKQLAMHLESLDDVDSANVTIAFPKDQLFAEDKQPVTASIVILPRPASDITTNQKKIQGIVKLVQFAVPELKAENITITDKNGILLNDFSMLDVQTQLDRVNVELEQKRKQETGYYQKIKEALSAVVSAGRVRVINVEYQVNTDAVTKSDREIRPITLVPDNPLTPYSELEITPNILAGRQSSSVEFKGSGFNPEGPPGQEGQTPPAYQDLQSATGTYNQQTATENFVYNQADSQIVQTPWKRERISVSVAIDGNWIAEYDADGKKLVNTDGSIKRNYIPVTPADVEKIRGLVRAAVGYDASRGDQVTVEEIQFDRSAQFALEDAAYQRELMMGMFMLWGFLGLLVLTGIIVVAQLIAKERERRRRLREEELARQHQAMREAALRSLEVDQLDPDVSSDVRHNELQEHAMNLARERPQDVAQLIRTWLSDEQ